MTCQKTMNCTFLQKTLKMPVVVVQEEALWARLQSDWWIRPRLRTLHCVHRNSACVAEEETQDALRSVLIYLFFNFDAILLSPLSFLSQQSNVKLNALLLVVGKFLWVAWNLSRQQLTGRGGLVNLRQSSLEIQVTRPDLDRTISCDSRQRNH